MLISEIEVPEKEQWVQSRISQLLTGYKDYDEDAIMGRACAELEYELNFYRYDI